MRSWRVICGTLLLPALVQAQSEQALREAFEGKTVQVKIDMPATKAGIDVRPGQTPPIDFARLGDLMKREGTSVKAGESILVTRVKVKKDLVEFQLGGGGYGTFGDALGESPSSDVVAQGKSGHEKQLEDQIRAETDPGKKKSLERELKDARHEREADNARAQAEANQANQLREANIQQKKLRSGSRFNLRYADAVPSEVLTPAGLRAVLAAWVDFGASAPGAAGETAAVAPSPALRKGLTLDEVEKVLGPAVEARETTEGSMPILQRTYRRGDEKIVTKFVAGVLVEYAISSN